MKVYEAYAYISDGYEKLWEVTKLFKFKQKADHWAIKQVKDNMKTSGRAEMKYYTYASREREVYE